MLGLIVATIAGFPAAGLGNVLAGRMPSGAGGADPAAGHRVPARAAVIVVATVGGCALTGWRLGLTWSLPGLLVFVATIIPLAVVDIEHHLLPRRILLPGMAVVAVLLVVAAGARHDPDRLAVAVTAAGVAWAVFAVVHLIRPAALGFGDVRLAGLLGLALGWLGPADPAVAILFGCLLAVATWVVLGLAGRVGRTTPLPFGAFLAAGAVVTVGCVR